MSTGDPLLARRAAFPILDRTTYLISNSLGAMPAEVPRALAAYADEWATRGVRAWEDGWWEVGMETGDLLAPILGAPSGSVVMHQNVTVASAVVRSCFDFEGARNKIVMVEPEFPSVLYLWEGARRLGAEIERVPASDDGLAVDLERLLDAIDERTAIVPVSHVLFRSAFVMDAEAICARAREVGARVCLDVFQSAGTVPLELERWGADFAVGGCLKWLCGGPGNAFLYVREDLHDELEPHLTGWQAAARPFDFEPVLERSESAWRFLTGTPNVLAHYAARPGLEIVGEIGVEAIREKSRRLTAATVERADALGIAVATPRDPDRRGGTVTLAPPAAERVARDLLEEEVLIDHRPGAGIRLSPHFYNTEEEVVRAVDRMADRARSGIEDAGTDRRAPREDPSRVATDPRERYE
ncbi:MAG: aminotransferase class V-fold PLP-dependent enzyme [Gemmatimonadota bacterium]|nr:aminotransferase class V-fold PLP-dependent enzyme [Gemmatimonadota bacterium]